MIVKNTSEQYIKLLLENASKLSDKQNIFITNEIDEQTNVTAKDEEVFILKIIILEMPNSNIKNMPITPKLGNSKVEIEVISALKIAKNMHFLLSIRDLFNNEINGVYERY